MIFNDMLLSGGLVTGEIIVTITGRNTTIEYDGQSHSVSSYNVSFSDPAYTINDFSFSGTATASGTNVGEYAMGLEAAQFTNTNPKFKSVTFVVTDGYVRITGRRVTVTAEAKSKTYDNDSSTDPALTATVSGTLGADTVTYSVSRVSGENAGEYTITPSGDITQGNYLVQYVAAKFTINRKPVTVKGDDASKTYGDSDPVFTATATGLIGTDTVTYTVSRATGNNVGTYAITPTGQVTQGNYTVAYQAGTFTINRKAVIVKANDAYKTYGDSDPTLTATVTGLVGSDTISYTLSRASGSNVGTYTITPTGNATQGNYTVTYQTGTFTISRKAVTVKADNKSKTYGASDPTLTATVTGLVGSDTVSYSLARASGSNVGTYTITPTGNATQGNYTVTYQTGTFTINKAAASALGLIVTSYSGAYSGSSRTITVSVVVTSGTTLYYSTDNSTWSTTKPTRTQPGTTTVYVQARNSNYNTASATGTISISGAVIALSWPMGTSCYVSQGDSNYYEFSATDYPSGTASLSAPTNGLWTAYASDNALVSRNYYSTASILTSSGTLSVPLTAVAATDEMDVQSGIIYHSEYGTHYPISDIPNAVWTAPTRITHEDSIRGRTRYYGYKFSQNGYGYYGMRCVVVYHNPQRYSVNKIVIDYENTGPYQNGGIDNCLSVIAISESNLIEISNGGYTTYQIPVSSVIPLTGRTGRVELDMNDYYDAFYQSDIFVAVANRGNAAGYLKSMYQILEES